MSISHPCTLPLCVSLGAQALEPPQRQKAGSWALGARYFVCGLYRRCHVFLYGLSWRFQSTSSVAFSDDIETLRLRYWRIKDCGRTPLFYVRTFYALFIVFFFHWSSNLLCGEWNMFISLSAQQIIIQQMYYFQWVVIHWD